MKISFNGKITCRDNNYKYSTIDTDKVRKIILSDENGIDIYCLSKKKPNKKVTFNMESLGFLKIFDIASKNPNLEIRVED